MEHIILCNLNVIGTQSEHKLNAIRRWFMEREAKNRSGVNKGHRLPMRNVKMVENFLNTLKKINFLGFGLDLDHNVWTNYVFCRRGERQSGEGGPSKDILRSTDSLIYIAFICWLLSSPTRLPVVLWASASSPPGLEVRLPQSSNTTMNNANLLRDLSFPRTMSRSF